MNGPYACDKQERHKYIKTKSTSMDNAMEINVAMILEPDHYLPAGGEFFNAF